MNRPVVMFVDDEEHILKSLRRLFRKEGYEILSYSDPKEAAKAVGEKEIDVIVSDQRMPGMSGAELLAHAREVNPDAVRIMLTGYTDLQSAEEAINKGEVWRFLVKPWNDEDLRVTVRQAVNLVEMRRSQKRMIAQIRAQNMELAKLTEQLKQRAESSEKKLDKFQKKIADTDKLASLGLMAGGVAHELNNPLGGILTMTQLILEEIPEDSPIREDLKEIEEAALHCRDIVSNLLHFARQGREPKFEQLQILEIINTSARLVKHHFKNMDINLDVEVPDDLPLLWGDASKLQQVFVNLITNAAQAMPGGGTIKIKAYVAEDGRNIAIDVIDRGVGIPADKLDSIFDPFFTTKEEGQGTGLGLSVSHGIVKEHRGEITVESTEGKGSRFTVYLPIFADLEASPSVEGKEDSPGYAPGEVSTDE